MFRAMDRVILWLEFGLWLIRPIVDISNHASDPGLYRVKRCDNLALAPVNCDVSAGLAGRLDDVAGKLWYERHIVEQSSWRGGS